MPEMQVRMAEYKAELFIQKLDVIFIHFNKIGIIIFMNSNKDWLWKLFYSDLSTYLIGNRKDALCSQLHGQVSSQPKHCRSAALPCLTQRVEHFIMFQVLLALFFPISQHFNFWKFQSNNKCLNLKSEFLIKLLSIDIYIFLVKICLAAAAFPIHRHFI